ncbi:MAG: hypothetical protein H7233_00840 [Pseudorhodobacter sp.]|nr:hypothetical protein [Frankiaceae bacterium]
MAKKAGKADKGPRKGGKGTPGEAGDSGAAGRVSTRGGPVDKLTTVVALLFVASLAAGPLTGH